MWYIDDTKQYQIMPSLLGIVKVLPGTTRYYLALPEIVPAKEKKNLTKMVLFIKLFYLVSCSIT
jgi:hypothetical protein